VSAPAKFLFEQDFGDGSGRKPAERTIPLAEHTRHMADAEAAGHAKGMASAEAQARVEAVQRSAAALERVAHALEAISANLQAVEARLETEAIEVAVAVAKKLAPELIAREPLAEIAALATDCFGQLVSAPHVVVRVSDAVYGEARDRLDEICRARGMTGRLVVLAEPDIKPGDCRIEWADGGINRDRAAAEAAIEDTVGRYVAARRAAAEASEQTESRRVER
jgi:flagellar assembly protein FliH